mgnify:CR=1 FL=1
MLFLEYPKCSTCKKAKKWLDEQGISYEDRHIIEDNPTVEELKDWHERSGLPLKRFFNTSGMKYRELGLKDKIARDVRRRTIRTACNRRNVSKTPTGCRR